jgi:hypothetical protein
VGQVRSISNLCEPASRFFTSAIERSGKWKKVKDSNGLGQQSGATERSPSMYKNACATLEQHFVVAAGSDQFQPFW